MLEAGANLVDVSKILVHPSFKMTMRYTHTDDSLKSAVERLTLIRHNNNHNKLSDG